MFAEKRGISSVIISAIITALCAIATKQNLPDWLIMFFQAMSIIFLSVYLALYIEYFVDNIIPKIIREMREVKIANVYHLVTLANSLRGLSTLQTDVINRYDLQGAMVWALDDKNLNAYVETQHGKIPWLAVEEFILSSVDTEPFLFPERDALKSKFSTLNKEYATAFTEMLIYKGWAIRGTGNRPAKLTVPLGTIAKTFGVEINNDD